MVGVFSSYVGGFDQGGLMRWRRISFGGDHGWRESKVSGHPAGPSAGEKNSERGRKERGMHEGDKFCIMCPVQLARAGHAKYKGPVCSGLRSMSHKTSKANLVP